MKQILAIFLLVVYTCSGYTLQQLQKAPVLVTHFQEHQQATPGISLTQYLVMHYLSGHANDADHDRDMQLPFKTTNSTSSGNLALVIPPSFPVFSFVFPPAFHVHGTALNDGFHSSRFLSSIWQPPRSC